MPRTTAGNRLAVRDFVTALNFNGTSAVVAVTTQLFYQNTGYSVSCWVKSSNTIAGGRVIGLGSTASANQNWILGHVTNGKKIALSIRNDANTTILAATDSTTDVFDGRWHHIVVTDNNGTMKLYVDGALDATNFNYTRSGTLTINRTAVGALIRTTTTGFFTGLIDDVRIYNNTVLTQAQVQGLYFNNSNPSGNTSWYKFDEGSGTTATDSGSLATNGTITDATYSTDVFIIPRTTAGRRQLVRDFGTSLSFNGSSAKVQTALWAASASGVTMAAWFKSDNFQRNRQPIMINGNSAAGGNRGQAIVLSGNATTDGSMMLLDANVGWIDLNFKVQDAYWHHIVVVINSSSSVTTYLDGVDKGTITGISPTLSTPNTNSYIGADNSASGFFLGKIDSARFYNSALTATTAADLYYGIESAGIPLNWYKFDEGSGSTANDSGSSAKNGTITAATYSTDVFMKARTIVT